MRKFKHLAVIMSVLISLFMMSGVCAMAEEADEDVLLMDYPDSLIYDYDPELENFLSDEIEEDVISQESEGYLVLINSDYVNFTDAAPVNINSRIMVPFRAILESLNAEVQWDNASKTVTAVMEDTTISFKVGEADINIVKGEEKSVKKMDVVPYINSENNRTYVSTRFVAESLGYTVGWDSENETVVIIDKDSILEGIDSEFSIINNFLENVQPGKDTVYEQTIKTALGLAINKDLVNLLAGTEALSDDIDFKVAVEGSALTKNNEISMDISLSMNAEDIMALASDEEGELSNDTEILKALNNISVKAYADVKTGDICFTTNNNKLLFDKANENTWFKMNLYNFMEGTGIDISELVKKIDSGEVDSVHNIIDAVFDSVMSTNMSVDTFNELNNTYNMIKAVASDKAIKVKKSKNETTYTMDLNSLTDSIMGYVGSDGGGMLVIKEKDGAYTCSVDFGTSIEGFMSIYFNLDTACTKSDASVQKMPSGAEVIDLSSMYSEILKGIESINLL